MGSVSCRSFEKRYAEAEPGFHNFDYDFQSGSISQSYDCTGPAGCGPNIEGYTFNTQNVQNHATHFNQQYNQGSRDTNFSHGKKKRSAEADAAPGFKQTFQDGSHAQNFDCTGPAGCGPNVGGFTFNTQNVQNHADHFNQEYNGGSRATNFSHGKKKRSAKADAEPGFVQTFQGGSHSQSFDCTGPNGCPNAGGFEFNTQNIRNQAAQFNQQYNQGSSATNFSHGKKKRSAKADAEPGFQQTFQAGSHSQSFDCTGIAGCGQNVGGFTFNTQNVQNHADHFNQEYNGGSRATNFSHGKK